jgi:ankyrin repeat protein
LSTAVQVVQALLQHKANPNMRNGDGDTPLTLAVSSGSILCCKLLTTAKASVVQQDADGYTAVHFAAGFGYLNILSHFIDISPSSCDIKSKTGVSPALCAILNGHVECLIFLLRKARHIATSRVAERNTLLHIACQEGSSSMCQALLSCGAVISMQNNNGDTPIDVVLSVFKDATLAAAKRVGLRECFLLLMKHRELQELEEEKQVASKSTPSGFLLAACKGNIAEMQRCAPARTRPRHITRISHASSDTSKRASKLIFATRPTTTALPPCTLPA